MERHGIAGDVVDDEGRWSEAREEGDQGSGRSGSSISLVLAPDRLHTSMEGPGDAKRQVQNEFGEKIKQTNRWMSVGEGPYARGRGGQRTRMGMDGGHGIGREP